MSSAETPKTVLLSGDPIQYEDAAASAITPGEILVFNGGDVEPGAAEAFRIARERDYIGEGIDDEIPSGENVPYYVGRKGDRFYAFLADGEDVSKGDTLEADTDGILAAEDTGTAVAVAAEDLNNTSGDPARIKVEVL